MGTIKKLVPFIIAWKGHVLRQLKGYPMKYSKSHYKKFDINGFKWVYFDKGKHCFSKKRFDTPEPVYITFLVTDTELLNGYAHFIAGDRDTAVLLSGIYGGLL